MKEEEESLGSICRLNQDPSLTNLQLLDISTARSLT